MKYILNSLLLLIIFVTSINANEDLKKVSIQLLWKHQFEFAGYYMAKEKGFYKDVKLDVKLKEFTFKTKMIKDVLEQKTTFGIGYSSIILNKLKGDDIVLINTLLQTSPHVLISLKSSKINTISDFIHHSIKIMDDEEKSASIKSMLYANKISLDQMKRIKYSYNIYELIDKKVDIASVYLSNEPYVLEKLNIAYKIWDPKDYGFEFYDDLLFTSSDYIKNNPKTVNDFNHATLKGWKYAFEHIEETIKLIQKKYNIQNKSYEALKYESRVLKSLSYTKNIPLGYIEKTKVQRIMDIYNLMSYSKSNINIDQFVYKEKKSFFNNKELEYFKNKKVIKMCIDPNWLPFEKIENKKHIGMSAEYFAEFQKHIPIPIKLVITDNWLESIKYAKEKKCDILSFLMETPLRKEYLNFTKSYFNTPLVIATKLNVSFINDFEKIKDKKIGIPKGYASIEIFKKKYPYLNIVEVENIDDGLKKVNEEKIFGYVGTLASVGYKLQGEYIATLKIAGKFNEEWDLRVGVRKDDLVLLGIFDKVISLLDTNTKQRILNHWIDIQYDKANYTIAKNIAIFLLLIISYFVYRQYKLKKEIKEFDQLLDITVEAIIIVRKNICLNVNKSAVKIFGYSSKKEMINKNVLDFASPKSHKKIILNIKTHTLSNYEAIGLKKNKEEFPIQIYITQFLNKGINVISVLDLSIIKQQEKTLSEQSKLVAMGEMIGNIAHQWRQPLSVISTSATGMQLKKELDMLDDESFNKTCTTINENAQYLSKTIDDFKNFVKGNEKQVLFNLNKNVNSFLHLLEGTIKKYNIKIIKNIDESINIYNLDNQLIQCYINIINNSRDAFEQHNIKERYVFINIYKIDLDVIISLKDNAGGIPKEYINKVFEPYFTTKHESQGTGIGLNMTYKLITEGMHGNITVSNDNYMYNEEEQIGANFKIILPYKTEE